jgi:ABC-2 type transport system ATP-binding protein
MGKRLGNLIRAARTDAGFTQAQLAGKIRGISQTDIGRYERGEAEPTAQTVKEIAKACGVTQKSLLDAMPKTASKPSGSKTGSASGTSMRVTATEKRLVELYRQADTETKKKVLSLLRGDNSDVDDIISGIGNFIGDVFAVPPELRQTRIRDYAARFELTDDLAQPISAYSHGMKQKLAIISAWLHQPKLILMDEPFVGLDPKASHLLKEMMREHCDLGGAIFFSTHVLEVAEKLCDKVAIIRHGALVRSGTMDEVKGDASLEAVFLELEAE